MSDHKFIAPPAWLERFLEKFLDEDVAEGILGDLSERFQQNHIHAGQLAARWLYFWQTVGYLRYFNLRNRRSNSNWKSMLRNHFIITVRTYLRHKVHSMINTLGLVIGLTAGFLILQYVHYEYSYDEHLTHSEDIYRVQQKRYNHGVLTTHWAGGSAGIGNWMQDRMSEVKRMAKLTKSQVMIEYNQEYYRLPNPYYVSEEFFELFSIPLLRGVDSTVLNEPWTVALSASTAKLIFGDEDPMGKEIRHLSGNTFKVTGIFADIPENSHMSIDLMYSFKSYVLLTSEEANSTFNWDGFLTYVELYPGTSPAIVEEKFEPIIRENFGEEIDERSIGLEFYLTPVRDIHLTSQYRSEFKTNGNGQAVTFLLIIAFFILIIAWINYINLATARAMQRGKEVGVRKVLGSYRRQLFNQFMFESAFINLVSLVLATLLLQLVFPLFNDFTGRSQAYTFPSDPWFWLVMAGIIALGTVLSGLYPALIMSGFKPAVVLKGKFERSGKGQQLRRVLVLIQFFTSIILITGTFTVYSQLDHLRSQDIGVNIDQTLVLRSPQVNGDSLYTLQYDIFKTTILQEAQFEGISSSSSVPGGTPNWNAGGIRLLSQTDEESNQYRAIAVDQWYIDFYEHELVAGRSFDHAIDRDGRAALVSESAVATLGKQSPEELLTESLLFWGDTVKIVGVLKNYHQESPKAGFDHLIFRYFDNPGGYYSIKVNTTDMRSAIDRVQAHWRDTFGEQPMDYFFLDDHYNEQYKAELRFGTIFGAFSTLAIIVACLGLFGLASHTTAVRIKEVGIRKVLGANTQELMVLLSKDFLKLVGVAIVLSLPFSWFLLDTWLGNFASRVPLSWYLFVLPGLLLGLIAFGTICFHVMKTVRVNPASTLKYE